MITLRNVTLERGAKRLLEGVDLSVFAGQKVGIVGPNGSGKSSLLALLRGELHCDAGELDVQPGITIAHVAQETKASADAALDYVLDGDGELRRIEAAIERENAAEHTGADERARAGGHLGELHERLAAIGGYGARARAAQIMRGLGFSQPDLARPVCHFSGGWRMRLNLAQALMTRSDLLLLDEPTNHLDLDAVLWLEDWLTRYDGALLLISHDREFLDNTVGHICHLESRTLRLYKGNYSEFERQRAMGLQMQQAAYDKQQREIAHLQQFVDRFRAKATKARQAQSRLKALERLERIAAVQVATPFAFRFREPLHAPQVLLTLERLDAGYAGIPVLRGVDLTLRAGARIGLLGANGAGKSTLVKTLAGELAPVGGDRREGKGLEVGYFAQHQLEQLRPEDSPLQHLARLDRRAREQDLRDYLGGFNFRGEMADAPVERFSGGEKARLVLALLISRRPNLLLLDEPTNHLDLDMREALTIALQEFEGAVVLVSHDRHLLRATAEDFLIVAEGCVAPFDGDLEDYRAWLAGRRRDPGAPAAPSVDAGAHRKQQRRLEAEARNRLSAQRRPIEKRLHALEAEMAQLSADKTRLETLLADPNLYAEPDRDRLKVCLADQARIGGRLKVLEDAWLQLQEQLEALEFP
ncbi:MAG TPA: ATP-binding cassette domain-containing protein [Burkholderiales bacterium]|nr:ATP-binding cassette domain-containing protein [Burkholderiales bacterium]